MIQANNVCLSFGEQIVFDNVSFTVNSDQRIGLVGRNGSGKSTLLKAIAGDQHLDSGTISISNKQTVAYMPQEVVLDSNKSILEELLTACGDLRAIQEEIDAMDVQLGIDYEKVDLERYSELQATLADLNPAKIAAQAQEILLGLGFKQSQLGDPVSQLSVGWKMRIVLAKLLLQNADFYLFDEPTNHLDIVAKDWFLNFLKSAKFGFMLVSHERYFLDKLCTQILEIERGKGTFYNGNYSKYVVQKEHNLAILQSQYVQQQKELKQKMETIERFRASAARARSAQSMLKAVEKIDLIELPPGQKTMTFSFPPPQQSGRIVLEIDQIGHKFGDKQVFDHAAFQIERGEKVAIVAPNGVGKSTLFHIIIGQLEKQKGSITLGHNVKATIFAQDQTKSLDMNRTILENITQSSPRKGEGAIRAFLGSFLFSSDDVHKKVGVLSGGEKNRVGMVNVLLQEANLLLLDEPTNHLDIPSKEILVKALTAFPGTIVFVSHDHDFINTLATRIIELTPTGTYSYIGNYESFLYQKKNSKSAAITDTPAAQATSTADEKQETERPKHSSPKEIKKTEARIEKIEKEIQAVELSFSNLSYGSSAFKIAQEQLITMKKEHEALLAKWETLQNK